MNLRWRWEFPSQHASGQEDPTPLDIIKQRIRVEHAETEARGNVQITWSALRKKKVFLTVAPTFKSGLTELKVSGL